MGYNSNLSFTIDGRPTVEDIHYLFSILASQVEVSTHKQMFRSYENTFISEDCLKTLVSREFSLAYESSGSHLSTSGLHRTLSLNRGMAKALVQQFIWSRLIENAHEPYNKTYKDKGIWKLTSKGLCIIQESYVRTNSNLPMLSRFVYSSSRLMFLIQIERLPENDRMNCNTTYISSLFALMIASLPLRQNINNDIKISHPLSARHQDTEDAHSINSADSHSTFSAPYGSRGLSFSDYFPFMRILPNDILVNSDLNTSKQPNVNTCFQQQKILIQNLNPSSNKFKMRAIFPSMLCCNWLLEFCTVASNDEAESIMTEFLNLGWISFLEDKHKYLTSVESSKSQNLKLTPAGMKVVVDISLEKHNRVLQQNQSLNNNEREVFKRYSSGDSSFASSVTSKNYSGISISTDMTFNEKESIKKTGGRLKLPTLPYIQTNSIKTASTSNSSSTVTTPIFEKSLHTFETNQFDVQLMTPPFLTTPYIKASDYYTNSSISSSVILGLNGSKDSNALKLKAILKNDQLQLLFRDFLCENFCVENFDFWKDYEKFSENCRRQKTNGATNHRQLLEDAYVLWDMYLKPGALRELNINYALREAMAEGISKMLTVVHTHTSGHSKPLMMISTHSPVENLTIVENWFEKVNEQICKLMATDSVPRFVRTQEYKEALIEIQLQDEEGLKKKQMYKKQESRSALNSMKNNYTIIANDLDDFPPPPQRKSKETIYL